MQERCSFKYIEDQICVTCPAKDSECFDQDGTFICKQIVDHLVASARIERRVWHTSKTPNMRQCFSHGTKFQINDVVCAQCYWELLAAYRLMKKEMILLKAGKA